MKQRLRQFTNRLAKLSRRLARKQVAAEIERYHITGEEPQSELGRSYVTQARAFDRMTNESVGGADFDNALEDYKRAADRYFAACRNIGTSPLRFEHDSRLTASRLGVDA